MQFGVACFVISKPFDRCVCASISYEASIGKVHQQSHICFYGNVLKWLISE